MNIRSTLALPAIALLTFSACKKNDQPATTPQLNNGVNIVLLKVDYQTHQFEGIKVFHPAQGYLVNDSIPLEAIYKSPGDFGNITLKFAPTADTVFDGGIVWMGKGTQRIPEANLPTAAPQSPTATAAPDSAAIQYINKMMYSGFQPEVSIQSLWNSVKNLQVAKQLHDMQGKAGLFLYQPSVGVGNPADWDWYWVLYIKKNEI